MKDMYDYDFITLSLKKRFRIMKFMFIFLLAGTLSIWASDIYSQNTTIQISNYRDITIEQLIREVEAQTDYLFVYSKNEIDTGERFSLPAEEVTVKSALDNLVASAKLSYRFDNDYIILTKRNIDSNEPVVMQGVVITGKVVEADGQPLPGTTIVIKGTLQGTTTDANGAYSLLVPNESATLVFSYIGFTTQEIVVGRQRVINITLIEDALQMEEVVVVAYGSQKKVTVTGAIATVQTKELKQSSAANLSVALAGRLPGLTALQSSGMPGNDAVNLYLRGMGTVNGASPLILIDGIQRENLSQLDPNEVASISILKDASSTAVFGVRGANGVILVTTRQGEGTSQLNVSAEYGLQSLSTRFDRIHSWEFAELRNQAARNDGISEENLPFTPYMIQKYRDGSDRVFYPDRDIFHDYFHSFAPQSRINLNYSGSTDKIKYFVNAGYLNQQGLIKTETNKARGYDPSFKMNRYNFRTNIDYKIFNNLKVSAKLASYLEQMNSTNAYRWNEDINVMVSQLMQNVWTLPPTYPGPLTVAGYGVPENQGVETSSFEASFYGLINRMGYNARTSAQFTTSVGMEWGLDFITQGLSTKAIISYDGTSYTNTRGNAANALYIAYVARSADEECSYSAYRDLDLTDETITIGRWGASRYYMNLQYALDYARQFGRHNVTGMFLLQRDNWENNSADLPYNILGMSGRFTYNYDQRYMAEFNAGYNGSEQFHKDHRFGFFPAFSAGWVVTNESFLRDHRWLTHMKLRASYGKVGNDRLGGERFLYRTVVSEVGGPYSQLGLSKKIVQGKIGNELLSWEIAEKQNYGVDFQLFRDFSLSFDVFNEQRNNVLITRNTVPVFQGVPIGNLPKVNIGQIKNHGYETEAAYNKRMGNGLTFMVKGNFAYNRNEMVFMDEVIQPDDYAVRYRSTGYSIGQYFGYRIDKSNGNGYINTPQELEAVRAMYKGGGTPRLGDFIYSDESGNGVVDEKDFVPIGYPTVPRITYGFSGNAAYKGFDVSFLFTGIARSSTSFTNGFKESGTTDGFYTNLHRSAWTAERYLNGDRISYPALAMASSVSHEPNDFTIFNRSFIRLKTVELGYHFPEKWMKSLDISRMRVYVNANNLWVWSKLPVKTVDPEQTGSDVVPLMRMMNFGLNIAF